LHIAFDKGVDQVSDKAFGTVARRTCTAKLKHQIDHQIESEHQSEHCFRQGAATRLIPPSHPAQYVPRGAFERRVLEG